MPPRIVIGIDGYGVQAVVVLLVVVAGFVNVASLFKWAIFHFRGIKPQVPFFVSRFFLNERAQDCAYFIDKEEEYIRLTGKKSKKRLLSPY